MKWISKNAMADKNGFKKYMAVASGVTGSSGYTNYNPGDADRVREVLEEVFRDHPGCVVLQGSSDLHSDVSQRPSSYNNLFPIKPLAWFHNGFEGGVPSGIVLSRHDYEALFCGFYEKFKKTLSETVTVHRDPAFDIALFPVEYLHYAGQLCPRCGEKECEAGDSFDQGNKLFEVVDCHACGARWKDVYELKGYIELEPREVQNGVG